MMPCAMTPFAALLAMGLVGAAAAANLTCVATPALFVANLDTINYEKLNRPNVAAIGLAAAPPDNASAAYTSTRAPRPLKLWRSRSRRPSS